MTQPAQRPAAQLIREVTQCLYDLAKSELHLAQTELTHGARETAKDSIQVASSIVLMGLGGLALLSFAVIGLGIILQDQYWLSALIIGVILMATGLIAAYLRGRHIPKNLHLDATKFSLDADRQAVTRAALRIVAGHESPEPQSQRGADYGK